MECWFLTAEYQFHKTYYYTNITFTKMILVSFTKPSVFERTVRSLHLCFGYVVLLPALLFLWDMEKFNRPGVWCSSAERKKKARRHQHNLKIKSKCSGVFGGEVTGTQSPVCLALRR